MEYTVLARRFRPQAFGEVVGQQAVAQALRNAISAERVAHAYLFTGARGVGKTSMARILAKSLNCPNGVPGEPCNTCDVCQAISVGVDVDVLEIDGASNRGIEDIRSLRANVNVKSMRSRYKVYIIDEVHMLTREAFNALLKTLEEPPPSVKFIFCTTEPQKLPDTILSRCQRFDFGVIATPAIMQRLTEIAVAEGVEVAPAAVELVARRAAGSMRDSQSLFDQLLAFGGDAIVAADVHRLLGTAPDDQLIELVGALIARQGGRALELLNAASESGAQLAELADQLVHYHRDLMILAAGALEVGLLSVSEDCRPRLAKQAAAWGLHAIVAALQILSEAKGRMKAVTSARPLIELALVRISLLADLEGLGRLIEQLKTGKLPDATVATLPQAAVSRVVQAPVAVAATERLATEALQGTPAAQKKSESTAPLAGDSVIPNVEPPRVAMAWVPGRESEILSQVISELNDMIKSHAKNIASAAIIGPNQLVLKIPKVYAFSKTYFDRTESLAKLEQAVSRVVDFPVRVTIEFEETPVAATATVESNAAPAVAGRRKPGGDDDSFVKRVMQVFGATVVTNQQG